MNKPIYIPSLSLLDETKTEDFSGDINKDSSQLTTNRAQLAYPPDAQTRAIIEAIINESGGSTTAPANPAGFSYYRAITVDNTKVSSTSHSNFPVLISLTDDSFKTTGNGGKVIDSNGYDIAFYSDADLSNQLDHEIESYNASTGEILMWVRIPVLFNDVDTVFYVAYGNTNISSSLENSSRVWNEGFVGVYHFPNGTTLSVADSTANNNDGNSQSANVTAGTGQIDGGAFFDSATDQVDIGNAANLQVSTFTISCWIKFTGTPSTFYTITGFEASGNAGPFLAILDNLKLRLAKQNVIAIGDSTGTVSAGSFYYVGVTYNGSTGDYAFYINGAASGTGTNLQTFSFGDRWIGNSGVGVEFPGTIDEFRISNVIRSAGWVATEYNNQNSPSTFLSLGIELIL